MAGTFPHSSRRSFLKLGLVGTLALATAGGIYRALQPSVTPMRFTLDDKARSALTAIAPVMIGNINATPMERDRAVSLVVDAIAGLPLTTQKEIQDLFALLTLGPTRRFLAGVPDDWAKARPEDVAAFLQDWRHSRIGLLQTAYHALHDLILGPWYADASSWASIGYPGPLKELS